ncbi:sulfotransferase family protein [Glycomyces buryatensis]|uniref:Sulfotransferase n=1 Tax=Glycomyces buryatensis TaxID=2570927 RepID=A0A4S8QIG8_9ACTN|nr:sulfotransferase [Glycomyces buryatensis]THV43052.1 sulfotransferase [Glycomyces buryatensis]
MGRTTFTVTALNTLFAPAVIGRRGRVDSSIDKIVASAERATGGSADDHRDLIEGYRILLGSYANGRYVSFVGWSAILMDIERRITNRMRVARTIAERPEIEREVIREPIVVTGLPRTATTLAHNLLAGPAANRAPLLWELLTTLPGDADEAAKEAGIADAKKFTDGLEQAVPTFPDIHKMAPELPEECIFLMPFHSLLWNLCGPLHEFREWCEGRDYSDDYRYLKQTLQILQHKSESRRWVLKSPGHLWSLRALIDAFPDARVVWTHRDPVTVMGSFCSLMEASWSVYQRRYDPAQIGALSLAMLTESIADAREIRLTLRQENLIDVGYPHLAGDPAMQVPRLFDRLGLPWGQAEADNLQYLIDLPTKRRKHEYTLSRYGLSQAEVEEAFGDYPSLVNNLPALAKRH